MFSNLILRNSRRSRKENGLFFSSLVISIVAFYMILSISTQDVMLFLQKMESDAVDKQMCIRDRHDTWQALSISVYGDWRQQQMKENWVYRRGDLYLANLGVPVGSKQGGVRPVVVLQNDVGNYYSPTITIAPLTSKIEKKRKDVYKRQDGQRAKQRGSQK